MMTRPGQAFDTVRAVFEDRGAIKMRGEYSFMASCPLHPDADPSLSVTWKPGRHSDTGGAVLMHCFSCTGSAADVAAAIGLHLADLFDNPLPAKAAGVAGRHARPRPTPKALPAVPKAAEPKERHQWRWGIVYTYLTAASQPVQQTIRQECTCADKGTHKRFVQRYRTGRNWEWQAPEGFTPVLYRARELARADARQWVWLTEGEKDAETAAKRGKVATTNPNGSSGFPDELAEQLHGRKVAIIVDRDRAGYERAIALHAQLAPHAAELEILLPAATAAKADLTDHVTEGHWDSTAEFGGLLPISPEQAQDLLTGLNLATGKES